MTSVKRTEPQGSLVSDERFGALAEAIPALVVVLNSELVPVYANQPWREYFGISLEDAHRIAWHNMVEADDYPQLIDKWRSSVPQGRAFEAECRLIRHDGTSRWHLARTVPVFGTSGEIGSWCTTLTDIHAIKLAEYARRASEERYRTVFEAIDEGFCIVQVSFDAEGRCRDYVFLETNPAFERHSGLTDPRGKSARKLLPNQDDPSYEIYGRVAATGEPHRFEKQAPGQDRWLSVYAFPIGVADEHKIAIVYNDITDQRRNERALRESEERFRTLADNIAQLAWMSDARGVPFWYNKRWYEYVGSSDEGEDAWSRIHPEHAPRVLEKVRRQTAAGRAWEDTFPLRGANGGYRWFLARAVPIRSEEGKVVRWFGTHTDITEHRQAQEALTETHRRKDEFLAVLAHELRNPLAPVHSAVDLLALRAPADPILARASKIIGRQVAHMSRLIDDLLDVSRIARGKIQLRMERCNLAEIVRQTTDDHRRMFDRMGLELTVRGAQTAWIRGDPTRLSQMIGNLLQNAEKFTQSSGQVEVSVEQDAETVRVAVRDTGAGIDGAMLERLFQPFTQGTTTLDRSHGGLGLGLALVKNLAELHGGSAHAESPGLGQGSTFTLSFPRVSSGEDEPTVVRREQPSRPLRIVIIEDNVDAAELLQALLQTMSHEVHVAYEGTTGLELIERLRPDVVLSDIGLPGILDGYGVARATRADPSLQGTYLVALSGYGQLDDRRMAAAAGFDAHLVKPVDYETLCCILEQAPRRA